MFRLSVLHRNKSKGFVDLWGFFSKIGAGVQGLEFGV